MIKRFANRDKKVIIIFNQVCVVGFPITILLCFLPRVAAFRLETRVFVASCFCEEAFLE